MTPRYGSFTLRTDCKHCGQPIPVNGPSQRVHCNACQNDVDLPDAIWAHVFGHFEDVWSSLAEGIGTSKTRDVLGFTVHYEYGRGVPRCEKCNAPFPAERLEPGANRDFWCVSCGDPASAYPAPQWLRDVVPTATEVYSTEPGAGPAAAKGVVPEAREDAPKPVVMSCPQCGASLRITAETERTTTCQYCKTDVYLPDDLWRRLHPVKVVRPFYVRFDGKTEAQLAAERRAEMEAARQQRARADAVQRDAELEQAADAKHARVMRLKRMAYGWIGVAYGLMALTLGLIGLELGTGALGDAAQAVCAALTGVTVVFFLATVWVASRVVQVRTGYDGSAMMFVAWFYLIFGFVMPVVGQIMVLVMGIKRFTGTLGGVTITSGGSSTNYPKIQLEHGETFPLGLAYVAFAFWWPATVFGLTRLF